MPAAISDPSVYLAWQPAVSPGHRSSTDPVAYLPTPGRCVMYFKISLSDNKSQNLCLYVQYSLINFSSMYLPTLFNYTVLALRKSYDREVHKF